MSATKPFTIPKRLVYEAFKAVKANAGSAGVDGQSLEEFEQSLPTIIAASMRTSRSRGRRELALPLEALY